MAASPSLPEHSFPDVAAWTAWLERHHASAPGLWLRLAKKASGVKSVSYAEALEVALCHGWIDGQKKPFDETYWLQKFTPRGRKSIWSKVNCGRVEELVRAGRMRPAGLAAVIAAQEDGRWEAAYDSAKTAKVPEDLAASLAANPAAEGAWKKLTGAERYSILFRLQTARKPETRARRLKQFLANLVQPVEAEKGDVGC